MDILIDFDGTCVAHAFPAIGHHIGAVPVLKELVASGHNLILFTMRSNTTGNTVGPVCVPVAHNGPFLDDAVAWFKQHDIPLYGIQTNPTQAEWTSSPKAYGQLMIDDAALGCPLVRPDGARPFVDWIKVRRHLYDIDLIPSPVTLCEECGHDMCHANSFCSLRNKFVCDYHKISVDANALETYKG